MRHDDIFSPILGRRQILQGAGAMSLLGLARLAGAHGARGSGLESDLNVDDLIDPATLASMCVLTPSLTAGPYYLPLNLVRSNIKEGQSGLRTRLYITVVDAASCAPIPNAEVDVWHNNAPGVYSGIAALGTSGETWLRGIQLTDASGLATLDTIYPGWYPGRTTHVHLRVRPTGSSQLTTQMYFQQSLSNRIYRRNPYSLHGLNPTKNITDSLYRAETEMSVIGLTQAVGLQLGLTIGVA
jgi:protocatechuate 3,4-dioxygenase beta subunit